MKKLLLALAFLLLGISSANASAGFNTTYGTGTGDRVFSAFTGTQSANLSVSYWVVYATAPSTTASIINTGSFGSSVTQAQPAQMFFFQNFSSTAGQWTIPITAGTNWQHVCYIYNNSSTSNAPTIYLNGISQSVTVKQGAVGTATTAIGSFYVGNASGDTTAWQGKIADLAVWNGTALTANQCKALAKGVSPLRVAYPGLSLYLPLFGKSGEPDWGPGHYAQTVLTTHFQPDPPLNRFSVQEGF